MSRRGLSATPAARRAQSGFSLVVAIFLLVVLAALAVFVVQIAMSQYQSVDLQLLTARDRSAAQSGMQVGVYQALHQGVLWCPLAPATVRMPLTPPALPGYSVTVTCSATAHRIYSAGSWHPYDAFALGATATYGTYGSTDFVSRTVWRNVNNAPP